MQPQTIDSDNFLFFSSPNLKAWPFGDPSNSKIRIQKGHTYINGHSAMGCQSGHRLLPRRVSQFSVEKNIEPNKSFDVKKREINSNNMGLLEFLASKSKVLSEVFCKEFYVLSKI